MKNGMVWLAIVKLDSRVAIVYLLAGSPETCNRWGSSNMSYASLYYLRGFQFSRHTLMQPDLLYNRGITPIVSGGSIVH